MNKWLPFLESVGIDTSMFGRVVLSWITAKSEIRNINNVIIAFDKRIKLLFTYLLLQWWFLSQTREVGNAVLLYQICPLTKSLIYPCLEDRVLEELVRIVRNVSIPEAKSNCWSYLVSASAWVLFHMVRAGNFLLEKCLVNIFLQCHQNDLGKIWKLRIELLIRIILHMGSVPNLEM